MLVKKVKDLVPGDRIKVKGFGLLKIKFVANHFKSLKTAIDFGEGKSAVLSLNADIEYAPDGYDFGMSNKINGKAVEQE